MHCRKSRWPIPFPFLEKRGVERLSNDVYVPLLGQIHQISLDIGQGKKPDLSGFEQTMHQGSFYLMDKQVQDEAARFFISARYYGDMCGVVRTWLSDRIREKIEQLNLKKEDLEKYRSGGYEIAYNVKIRGQVYLDSLELRDALILGKMPIEILKEERPYLTESDIVTHISGYTTERPLVDEIAKSVLDQATKGPLSDLHKLRKDVEERRKDLVQTVRQQIYPEVDAL
jgi:hypothetical protein